ncbi:putative transmembrane sensor domain protein [Bacteroidales bacterium Barb4]|nr:putative transmembrane sensor domain protein [Bacteroidales bacterium Barb4]
MGLKEDIINKAKEIESSEFEVEQISSVPTIDISELTFGCTGLEFEATVLYIDMRESTIMLEKHKKRIVAKIHMIYYHTIVKIAKATGGEIRSFNGDSLLVFYQGTTKKALSNAVEAAMQMRYAITELVNEQLKNYTDINFGIGIDDGKVLATKVGVGKSDVTKDLIWIGNAVNKSVKISEKCKDPTYIGISQRVYDFLEDNVKYGTEKNTRGQDEKVDMWTQSSFMYNGKEETYYRTLWFSYI